MSDRKPLDWPTAVVLVAFFAAVAAVVWAIAWMLS
jgi:hypothetical protein